MFKLYLFRLCLLIIPLSVFNLCEVNAQEKMIMDESVYSIWNSISDTKISNNGDWILYTQSPDQGNKTLKIYNTRIRNTKSLRWVDRPVFSDDSKYVFFKIKASKETVKELKRIKTKKDEMPKDSLGIYNLATHQLEKVSNIKEYKSPRKWNGVIAYTLDPIKEPKDTSAVKVKPKPKKKPKKKGGKEEESFKLVINNFERSQLDTIDGVTDFVFSEEGESLIISKVGDDSTEVSGVFLYQKSNPTLSPIFRAKGKYSNLSMDKTGKHIAFLADLDTTENKHRPYELYHWHNSIINKIADRSSEVVQAGWDISTDQPLLFSEDGKRLFFGAKPQEVLQDTSLLDEEIVNVEVWSYKDGKLYTQQSAQADREKKKSYLSVYDIDSKTVTNLGSITIPEVKLNSEGTGLYAVGANSKPYFQNISWGGFAQNDLFKINVKTGEHKTIANKLNANGRVSPTGKYFYWYNNTDTTWYSYEIESEHLVDLTSSLPVGFSNELHDAPSLPRSYGIAGWLEGDDRILIYDRYDVWSIDPSGITSARRLTDGRSAKTTYRVIVLDREEKFLSSDKLMMTAFEETDKSMRMGIYDLKEKKFESNIEGDYQYRRLIKARDTEDIVFTKESFTVFPDLQHSDLSLKDVNRVSIANPQQANYRWGDAKQVKFINANGKEVKGLLITPEGFDPKNKYPMIVNFYEKSSYNLHRHRPPLAGRSTIGYAFYANNGYVIFNPDIHYEDGYPGKSCYDNVVPGVEMLIKEGFVDKDRIAVQGHSWGGYQIAHLLTKTDMFRCAEAGAPVVNMVSAYGGIRWQTGLSRMFQYEKTQSRLGATLWERPDLYLDNSPIFNLDKMNTPVLIMHNDADGHVPWYQGIEYFVALRRLGKPAWMLNYNGEPHWPLKWQNRLDFNIRMKQFFDHYLKDAPAPRWMRESMPALEKGINLGYELEDASRH